MGNKERLENLFSWFFIKPSADPARHTLNSPAAGQSDRLLRMLDYYKTVAGLSLAPEFHKIFAPKENGFSFAEMSVDGWGRCWNDLDKRFEIIPERAWQWVNAGPAPDTYANTPARTRSGRC